MNKICEVLAQTQLFDGLSSDLFSRFCAKVNMRVLWKGEVLVNEGDYCSYLGIVASGQLALQKYSSSGDYVTISLLGPGESFGEELIFGSSRRFPNTIEAMSNCKVILLSKDFLLGLLQENPRLIRNFMRFLSDKVQLQDRRISILSQRSLRQKIACYLLDLLRDQGEEEQQEIYFHNKTGRTMTPSVELPSSKEVAARLLAMPRPSFSRELVRMEKDGLIKIQGRVIWLTNLEQLERGSTDEAEAEDF